MTELDRISLVTGKWLTATHISAAQQLMKVSFPSQNGLKDMSALEVQHKWQASPENFVQIIHVEGCHWHVSQTNSALSTLLTSMTVVTFTQVPQFLRRWLPS